MRLSALGGDPGWVHDHAAALTWQRTALNTGLFSSNHIETGCDVPLPGDHDLAVDAATAVPA